MNRLRLTLLLPLLLGGCAPDRATAPPAPTLVATRQASAVTPARGPMLRPAVQPEEQLVQARHLALISGDLAAARAVLNGLASTAGVARTLRARAELRLADLAEQAGKRRVALDHLEQAKIVAGPGHDLAYRADDRRTRILTDAPLADVRGPLPGGITLKGEARAVATAFRQAEQRLVAFHRLLVAPRIEEVSRVLAEKRSLAKGAVKAYLRLLRRGGPSAKAAAHFRLGTLYHHMAEALGFEIPAELLPDPARRLRNELRTESAANLKKALAHYRAAAKVERAEGTEPWQGLARREAATLQQVLEPVH